MNLQVVYDAGLLVAADRGDRRSRQRHRDYLERGIVPLVPAPVVVRAWRGGARQANLARLLNGTTVLPLDDVTARRAGELCGAAGTSDVTDAVVAVLAGRVPGLVLTSDPADLTHLLGRLPNGRHAQVLTV